MKPLNLLLIVLVILALNYMVNVGKQLQLDAMRDTYALCMSAHGETDGASEQACADAQDQTSTEFMCNNLQGYCWLEVK